MKALGTSSDPIQSQDPSLSTSKVNMDVSIEDELDGPTSQSLCPPWYSSLL